MSADDLVSALVSAFYSLVERDGDAYIEATVLPMGWSSAVGVHRRLALRSPFSGGGGLLGKCEIRQGRPGGGRL